MNTSADQIIAFVSRFAALAAKTDWLGDKPVEARFTAVPVVAPKPSHCGLMTLRAIREGDAARGEIVDFEWAYASGAAARMLDCDAGDLVGRRLLEVYEGQAAKGALLRHYKNVVERGDVDEAEFMHALDGVSCQHCHAAVRLSDGVVVTLTNLTAARQTDDPTQIDLLTLRRASHQQRGVALVGE